MISLLDSSVGIATCYELDGPGIELWCWRLYLYPSRPVLRPTQSPTQSVPCNAWSKTTGAWR